MRFVATAACLLAACLLAPARAEVLEEVVAHIGGDIITKTEFEEEEQTLISEAYRQLAGEELDRVLAERRESLLMTLIDRKILLHRAMRLYDVSRMSEVYYESFRRQQNIDSDEEFLAALAEQGMTVEELKEQLVEMFAPEDVIRIEVGGRVSVGDRAVEAFYESDTERFLVPGDVTIREIVLLADSEAKKEERRPELQAVLGRLADEEFEALARELSEAGTAAEGGLLGPLGKGDLAWRLEELAFKQPVGEFGMVETDYGFHIIKVVERSEDRFKPLEEVREDVRTYLENKTYMSKLNEFMEKARTESEWCVKDKYMNRLPTQAPRRPCASL